MRIPTGLLWFGGFTLVFAVLAAAAFWGCWSTTVTFVSPDDGPGFARDYADVVQRWWNGFLTTGKLLPTDLLWSGLIGSPGFCRELKYASAVYLAALGLVYFLRGRSLSRIAAYGSALLLAFCGYWFTLFSAGHAGWFLWMSYGVFAFGLIDRALEGGRLRHFLLLGLVVSWAGFNQQDLWLLFTAFTGVYFVYRLLALRIFPWKGILASALVFGLVGLPNFVGLADVVKGREEQIARGENITTDSAEKKGSSEKTAAQRWEFVTNWSLPSDETSEFFCSRLKGDTSCPFVLSINAAKGVRPYAGALGRPLNAARGNYRQHSLYVGWLTCLLALCGAVFGGRRSAFFVLAAVVFYLLSLGRYFEPAYRCIFALPAGDLIRCPVKWHHLTEFCLCVLAGYGIEGLFTRLGRVSRLKLFGAQVLLGLLVFVGAVGLVSNARLYCAPVDYSRAIASKCSANLTVIGRNDFANPQVAAMVRAGQIVSVANWLGNPDAFLVQVLEPLKPEKPAQPRPLPLVFGCVSVLTALLALVLAFVRLPFGGGRGIMISESTLNKNDKLSFGKKE